MTELDEQLSLPEDPELQFVEFEKMLRERMWGNIRASESARFDVDQKIYYATKLVAFHDAHDLAFLKRPNLSRPNFSMREGDEEFDAQFNHFTDEVLYWTTQIETRHARRLRPISTILTLTPEIRKQIHSYIAKIRETVLPIQLSDPKKETILKKLNALAEEIDQKRTKAEAWTAFTLELASASGQAAKELKPVMDFANSIGGLLGTAKRLRDETLKLAAPVVRKMIEGPSKQLPAPEPASTDSASGARPTRGGEPSWEVPKGGDLDDEIPF